MEAYLNEVNILSSLFRIESSREFSCNSKQNKNGYKTILITKSILFELQITKKLSQNHYHTFIIYPLKDRSCQMQCDSNFSSQINENFKSKHIKRHEHLKCSLNIYAETTTNIFPTNLCLIEYNIKFLFCHLIFN